MDYYPDEHWSLSIETHRHKDLSVLGSQCILLRGGRLLKHKIWIFVWPQLRFYILLMLLRQELIRVQPLALDHLVKLFPIKELFQTQLILLLLVEVQ